MGEMEEYINNIQTKKNILNITWKVLKCCAGEGWRRSVGPIV
jgi:hypothetical protein